MFHPNDDNGDALRRLEANGDDLSKAREINFSVVFRSEPAANEFAAHFHNEGYRAMVRFSQVKDEHPWDVTVVKNMIPSHSGITDFERELQEIAETLGGYNDGWGCFSQAGKHLQ